MLLAAAAFWQFILAIHIIAVIVAFGILFVYPLLSLIGARFEPPARAPFHRLQLAVHTRIQAPALVLVVLAGIYLASDLHQWSHFYVAWGLAASIVIGGIGGAYIAPRERRLINLAESGSQTADYRTTSRQANAARLLQLAITVVTIVFMSLQLGS